MNTIDELNALQQARGFLSDDDLRALSARIDVPLHELQAVSSFYPHFPAHACRRSPHRSVPRPRLSSCATADVRGEALGARCSQWAQLTVEFAEISCPGQCDRRARVCLVNDVPVALARTSSVIARRTRSSAPAAERRTAQGAAGPLAWRIRTVAPGSSATASCDSLLVASRDFDGAIARIAESGLRGMGGAGFPDRPQVVSSSRAETAATRSTSSATRTRASPVPSRTA